MNFHSLHSLLLPSSFKTPQPIEEGNSLLTRNDIVQVHWAGGLFLQEWCKFIHTYGCMTTLTRCRILNSGEQVSNMHHFTCDNGICYMSRVHPLGFENIMILLKQYIPQGGWYNWACAEGFAMTISVDVLGQGMHLNMCSSSHSQCLHSWPERWLVKRGNWSRDEATTFIHIPPA